MRKSLVRLSFAVAGLMAVCAQAGAQTVNFWYNSLGDASGNQPSVINVTSGSLVTLSVYLTTTGDSGSLSAVGLLFGYSTSNHEGTSAAANDSNIGTSSFVWGSSDLTSGSIQSTNAGGGGVADGTVRPYGWIAESVNINSFANSGNGINY